MTRQIRRVAILMMVLFGALFVQLNVVQLVRANDLANHPANRRVLIREYGIERGEMVVGGQAVVTSSETDDELKYLRVYEFPEAYAHLTGYYSSLVGRSGLEAAYNEALTGAPTEVLAQNLAVLLGQRDASGDTLRLTIDPTVQEAATEALGDRVGAVVALDPTTGAILASVSRPSYDPNRLASHDAEEVQSAWDELRSDPAEPLADRVRRRSFPPGSTMKLIVAAAALEELGFNPDTSFPDRGTYDVPQTSSDIGNFSPGPCTGGDTISLRDALRVSCNTVFAELGVDLGAEALIGQAERFGFNREPPSDLPIVESVIPKDLDVPQTAQSAIGEFSVRATPMQMAMVAAAIANDGVLLRPFVVGEILDPSGRTVRGPQSGRWSEGRFDAQAVSPQTAQQLEEMMVAVVEEGTGTSARIEGVRVGGKTGTAQGSTETPTVWFVGFAEDQVAVAVVLPDAGSDASGGRLAAPIARDVMAAAVGR